MSENVVKRDAILASIQTSEAPKILIFLVRGANQNARNYYPINDLVSSTSLFKFIFP